MAALGDSFRLTLRSGEVCCVVFVLLFRVAQGDLESHYIAKVDLALLILVSLTSQGMLGEREYATISRFYSVDQAQMFAYPEETLPTELHPQPCPG